MEGLKHTPGPWVVDEIGPPHEYTRYVVRAEGRGQIMKTIDEDDARLIAAAPEMLEALMLAHEELLNIARLQDWHSETFRGKIEKITTAIVKATGAKIDEVTARQEAER